MKKVLTFDRRPEVVSSGFSTDNGRSSAGDREPGYLIQNRDLGKIHKAASGGDQAKVKDILLPQIHDVDDRDKMNRFQEPLNMPKRNLNEELSFDRDLKPSLLEMGMQADRLIQETEEFIAASTCNHSPEDNTDQLEEEMKELQKKCAEMTSRAAWWKEEVITV